MFRRGVYLASLVCCLLVGALNGLLVGKFKLPPFIATLGTMFCARGVAYMANNNRNTDAISTGLGKELGDGFQNFFYYGKTLGVYNAFWIAAIIFLAVFFIMSKTRTGRHIYAIGSNVEAAKLSGVNVFATTTKVCLISAFCSFVVGLILAGQAGHGQHGSRHFLRDVRCGGGRHRRRVSSGRHRTAAGHLRRRRRLANPGKRSGHCGRPGGHSENRHRCDRHRRRAHRYPGPQRKKGQLISLFIRIMQARMPV